MAEKLLLCGVHKLWDHLARKIDRFQGFNEQVVKLKRELNLLSSFLEDADAKKHENKKTYAEEIKEIFFDADDIIETFLLKKELGQTGGIRKRMRRLSCITVDREISVDIEGISKRISKVVCDMKKFGVQQMNVNDGEHSHPLQERQREMRKTFTSNDENDLVGLEENVKKLVGYLVEKDSIQVVSITGMGGTGKTILARQVFNHEMVKTHFDGLMWVCLSQQFTRKYVWETILQYLSSKHDEQIYLNMSEDELQDTLFRLLETSTCTCLIVLDDIWKEDDWDIIKPVFPSKIGWKVLLTSRNEGVASRACPTFVPLKLDCLTPEESWTLFQMIAFPGKNTTDCKVDEEMEEMGKKMIKHCEGLPLAIKVLGGLLATHYTLSEWKRISEDIVSHIAGHEDMISVYGILELSIQDLPIHLKHCFLYLAHLPENYAIDVEDLFYYWAAEEIFGTDIPSYRKAAYDTIEELVKKNLVVITKGDDKTCGVQRCSLHNMFRDLCVCKAKEENFVQIIDASTVTSTENTQFQCKSRRLVIHSSNRKFDVEEYTRNPKLRSLLFIKHFWDAKWKVSNSFFTRLQLMRVLDLSGAEFEGDELSSDIGKLIHLRYLSLYMAKVCHLPSSMQNLRKLLYLNLCVCAISPICMPNILKEMRSLIYLFLPDDMQDKTKLELGKLVNLETLENFSTKHSSVRDLHGMTRLTTLSIIFNGEGCSMETLSSTLGKLEHLEKLTIGSKRVVGVRVKGKVLPVNMVGVAKSSFCEKKMVCSKDGFPQLKKLYLNDLAEWEEWIIEEGSMPLLQTLSISACRQLKGVPDGLKSITSLKELTIIKPGRELKEKLSRGGKDYNKVEHIPRLIIPEYDMDFSDEDNTEFWVYPLRSTTFPNGS